MEGLLGYDTSSSEDEESESEKEGESGVKRKQDFDKPPAKKKEIKQVSSAMVSDKHLIKRKERRRRKYQSNDNIQRQMEQRKAGGRATEPFMKARLENEREIRKGVSVGWNLSKDKE
eukprot:TRINITY_DN4664_c0_g1_i1.p1 TRINITY_DN4664_c0_g1~~TRINITY_DN4664_c0_g1_i1.p1  ORF type:complete len:117 (-),score=23.73 TRINITY_DN4664_c0_g1_i1:248-598(-)